MYFLYLHGFASSPKSAKARFFRERLAELGIALHCPDLNEPDFSSLTISRMLRQVEHGIDALPPGDVTLIGSSLGGFVAVEAAARFGGEAGHHVTRLVLLAPAVELEWEKWIAVGPGGVAQWRKAGSLDVFHYAYDAATRLDFAFYEDACGYAPASRRLDTPMLIVQGVDDKSVQPATVERFARAQPRATLHMVEDDHQLKNSLEFIWRETVSFLGLRSTP